MNQIKKEFTAAMNSSPDPAEIKCPVYAEMKRLVKEAEHLPSARNFTFVGYAKSCDCEGLSSGWRIIKENDKYRWARFACDTCDKAWITDAERKAKNV
jgi:hypothetical protein